MIPDNNTNRQERLLLIIAGVFVVINHALLLLTTNRPAVDTIVVLVWILCAGAGHFILRRHLPNRDPLLYPVVMLLVGWGLVVIDRLAPAFADRQAIWLLISTGTFVVMILFAEHIQQLQQYRYYALVSGITLLATTLFIGVNPSGFGPRLWLGVNDIFLQPSEPLKLIVLIFLAGFLADHRNTLQQSLWQMRLLGPSALIIGLCLLILIIQRDLGTATIFYVLYLLMLYLATERLSILVVGLGALLMAAYLGYQVLDIVALRIDIWLNPWPDADNRAYQIVQSIMALSAGGVVGVGVGQGLPTFIPVAHTDFVFAAIAEEWGLIGIMMLVFAFVLLIYRSLEIAIQVQTQSVFLSMLAAGIGLLFAVQSLMIMGGIVRLWPLTGVALPFVSYGGSSLLTSMLAVGCLLIISDRQP